MENLTLEEICKKYNEDKKVIIKIISISLKEGLTMEEIEKLLDKFYKK